MRKELERRPLVIALAGLLIGVSALEYPLNPIFLLPLAFFVRSVHGRLLACVFFAVGLLVSRPVATLDPTLSMATLEGTVISRPQATAFGAQTCLLATDYGRFLLRFDLDSKLSLRDQVRVKGLVAPGESGAVSRLPSLNAIRVERLAEGPAIVGWSDAARESFGRFAKNSLEPRDAALLQAMMFSSPELLNPVTKTELKANNAMMMVTSAGLHVLLIALAVQALMGLLPVPRWVQMLLLAAALTLFLAASGFHTSMIRAAIFALCVRSAYLFRREPDVLSAISAAGILMLLFDPVEVGQLGFQLTMLAAFGFALFKFSRVQMVKTVKERVWSSLVRAGNVTLIAALATMPLLAQSQHALFGESLIVGFVSTFVLPPVLVTAFLCYGLSFLFAGPAGWLLNGTESHLLPILTGVNQFLVSGLQMHGEVPYFSGYWLVLFYGLLLATRRPSVRRA